MQGKPCAEFLSETAGGGLLYSDSIAGCTGNVQRYMEQSFPLFPHTRLRALPCHKLLVQAG